MKTPLFQRTTSLYLRTSACRLRSHLCSPDACLCLYTTLFSSSCFFCRELLHVYHTDHCLFWGTRIGISYSMCTAFRGCVPHKTYSKKTQSKNKECVTQFSSLAVAFYDVIQNVFSVQKPWSVWSKHQMVPDKLSSSSSCCLSITFNGFTKNTNYLQERRGLSCQKLSHSNACSSISSHLFCEYIFQQNAPFEPD